MFDENHFWLNSKLKNKLRKSTGIDFCWSPVVIRDDGDFKAHLCSMTHRLDDDFDYVSEMENETKRGWRWFMLFWALRWLINDSARFGELFLCRLFFFVTSVWFFLIDRKSSTNSLRWRTENEESILNSSFQLCYAVETRRLDLIPLTAMVSRITNFISSETSQWALNSMETRFIVFRSFLYFFSMEKSIVKFMILISLLIIINFHREFISDLQEFSIFWCN